MALLQARRTFRLTTPPVSGRFRPRLLIVCLVLAVLTFVLFCVGMTIGDVPMSVSDVLSGLFGGSDSGNGYIVQELRLPRALTGLLAGIAFGASGAVFQTITRNPLASPDMIGINAGAATAVVAGIAFGFGGGLGTTTLGLFGGLFTAVLVYALAWRRGTTGYRILLVGIGIFAMCTSLTDYLLSRAQITEAQAAIGWMVGNLANRGWEHVIPLLGALCVLLPVVLALSRWMSTLLLGDEVAAGLGTPVQPVRLGLLLSGSRPGRVRDGVRGPDLVRRPDGTADRATARAALVATDHGVRAHRRGRGAGQRHHRARDHRVRAAGRHRHRHPRRPAPALAAGQGQPIRFRRLTHDIRRPLAAGGAAPGRLRRPGGHRRPRPRHPAG